ncbi:MAG TPA: flagellar basal body L-ring protein FlgH [Bryobacteraceae bacterium]|nr:flagellar basal body L-ring protein FlgH [Bryobacteraceae bacterium]
MTARSISALLALACLVPSAAGAAKKKKPQAPEASALQRYVEQAKAAARAANDATPGSLWSSAALLNDLARDLRASRVNDTVTVQVAENASALSTGNVQTARTSSASASVSSLAGPQKAAGTLANLLGTAGSQSLQGSGTIGRTTVITTTLGTRVVEVLPNGDLVIEGVKEIRVSSEEQVIMVRGVVRPADLSPNNVVQSDLIAQLEVSVNGKGVVGDAIRRPNFLYRLILGLLPF